MKKFTRLSGLNQQPSPHQATRRIERVTKAQQQPQQLPRKQLPSAAKKLQQARAQQLQQARAKQPRIIRPPSRFLTSLAVTPTRLALPPGCFNAGLVRMLDSDTFVCVYRPNEHSFTACLLDAGLNVIKSTLFPLGLSNCADPRLVWLPDGKLLMVYSSVEEGGRKFECIRGAVIMDLARTTAFIKPERFRISPKSDVRQKNWMPFVHLGVVHFVASVKPHIVYQMPRLYEEAVQVHESGWLSPWFTEEFLRGNTNPVQLDDGNYLGTFHSVIRTGKMHDYDNGCYVFEGKPPFRVLRAGVRTYLPAEAAIEPHFRKAGQIRVCFPVGMIRDGEQLLISYGDNDSAVKIMKTTVTEMLATTLEVY